ncbi:MAG: hypothetical protein RR420_05410 [Anaerovoracaceae bacterium]
MNKEHEKILEEKLKILLRMQIDLFFECGKHYSNEELLPVTEHMFNIAKALNNKLDIEKGEQQ